MNINRYNYKSNYLEYHRLHFILFMVFQTVTLLIKTNSSLVVEIMFYSIK